MRVFILLLVVFFSCSSLGYAQKWLGATIGTSLGFGTMKSQDLLLRDRFMQTITFQSLVGYNFNENLLVGAYGELRVLDQRADKTGKLGEDLSAYGWLLTPGVHWQFSEKFTTQFMPILFLGVHDRRAKARNSDEIKYKNTLGLRTAIGYLVWERVSLDLSFYYIQYREAQTNNFPIDISNNDVVYWNLGFGATYKF